MISFMSISESDEIDYLEDPINFADSSEIKSSFFNKKVCNVDMTKMNWIKCSKIKSNIHYY